VGFAIIGRKSNGVAQVTGGLARTAFLRERFAKCACGDRRSGALRARPSRVRRSLRPAVRYQRAPRRVCSRIDRVGERGALRKWPIARGVTFVQQRIAQIEMRVRKIRVDFRAC
jgi:hypothetical protein